LETAISPPPARVFSSLRIALLFRHFSFWTGMLGATMMLDTDATVTTGLRPSTFDRLPSSFGDPDQTDLDSLAASLDYLALSSCEPATDNANQHSMAEALAGADCARSGSM
jgi:hypothetical protein